MAEVIKKAVNKFTKGLVMDFSPENTQNELLTHALNATLLTFNGNELSLQNDMGNARVETAYLPNGYIPVGTCEFGGIIYIVSYNPLENKSQIGCFPSPERNISSDELGIPQQTISMTDFQETTTQQRSSVIEVPTGKIKNTSYCVTLKQDKLNPGDKFIICSDENIYEENLVDLLIKENGHFKYKDNPRIALNIVSIEESGKIVYLNSDLVQYEEDHTVDNKTNTYKYHILGKLQDSSDLQPIDIDNYRNTLQSGYSVFKSKTSGRLALLAELVTIDSYSVTHSIQPRKRSGDYTPLQGNYEIVIHTDVTASIPNGSNTVNNNVFNLIPKLKYYYLQNSQGQIPIANPTQDELNDKQVIPRKNGTYLTPLFKIDGYGKELPVYNPHFLQHKLSDIYNSTVLSVEGDSEEQSAVIVDSKLSDSSLFNFPKPKSYYGRMESYDGKLDDVPEYTQLYTKFTENKYHRVHRDQFIEGEYVDVAGGSPVFYVNNWDKYNYFRDELQAKFYEYDEDGGYAPVTGELVELQTYYTKTSRLDYIDIQRDESKKGSQLWKLDNPIPTKAEKEHIYDDTIEKWIVGEKHLYIPIPHEDLPTFSGSIYVYEENEDGSFNYRMYKETTFDPDTTYYSYEYSSGWVSIGYTPNPESYKTIIYYFKDPAQYVKAEPQDETEYWDFDKYPYDENHAMFGAPFTLFIQDPVDDYYEATLEERSQYEEGKLQLFENTHYIDIVNFEEHTVLFAVLPNDVYVPTTYFEPDVTYNYIAGLSNKGTAPSGNAYEKDDPLYLYKIADFIPKESSNPDETTITYEDVRLATIKIPDTITKNKCDLLFKYDYTIVPCMDYGRLDWLAVSNTIDFSNLHNFDQSNFNTWKYRIDGNQLRLTFGADIYDTFVDELNSDRSKVDALVLEFYDLWGFAGSIEISGKKAYSGIFTKLLALNTLGALSTKKIVGTVNSSGEIIGNYSSDYCRNIGITKNPDSDSFSFEEREIKRDDVYGWYYTKPKEETEPVGVDESDSREFIANDCGTLYANLIYGVKTYIRQSTSSGEYVFTPKTDFFLFTLPIYNEYYYVKNNFNELENPRLKFGLTYKLTDISELGIYDDDVNISNGYPNNQYTQLQEYTKGTYEGTQLNLVKYLTYTGKTDLNLEIGLQKEYQDFGISCTSDINKLFSCDLQLSSDDSNTSVLNVKSSTEQTGDILNYNAANLQPTLNKLGFNSTYDSTIKIKKEDFDNYNFLYEDSLKNTLPIHYTFVVGYAIDVTNIRDTQVPATTVCALCHRTKDEYNYEDFGIYFDSDRYYSNAMFYNEGTAQQEIFGICKQVAASGDMQTQCVKVATEIQDAQKRTGSTSLNTGPALKNLLNEIGILQFCQPHAHGFSSDSGVNIYGGEEGYSNFAIGPETDKQLKEGSTTEYIDYNSNNSNGNVPHNYLYKNPRYNLSLNTKMMIDHQGEFLSTIDYLTCKTQVPFAYGGDNLTQPVFLGKNAKFTARKYTGITGEKVTKFNECLITTMKSVYAYNPDYDSIAVKLGDVAIKDHNIQFSSNLICKGHIDDINLNDYICISDTTISTYLGLLHDHSSINVDVEQAKFKGNFTYCGTDSPLLVSTLTYNTQAPKELHEDLSFSANDQVVVQHADGGRTFVKGSLDKKALYGFKEDVNSLVQLDISNYNISQSTGELTLKEGKSSVKTYNLVNKDIWNSENIDGFSMYAKVRCNHDDISYDYHIKSGEKVITWWDPKVQVYSRPTFAFSVSDVEKFKFNVKIRAAVVNKQYINYNEGEDAYLFTEQSFNDLYKLFTGSTGTVALKNQSGVRDQVELENMVVAYYWLLINNSPNFLNHGDVKEISVEDASYKTIDVNVDLSKFEQSENYAVMLLIEVPDVIIHGVTTIPYPQNTVIPVSQTKGYYKELDGRYVVDEIYESSQLAGTSLTLNDLVYDPKPTGHRLYVRSNCCKYNNAPRSRIFYRTTSYDMNRYGNFNSSWCYYDLGDHVGTQYLNNMYLLTGPCFTGY